MLNAIFIQSRDLVILIAYPITGWQCFMAVRELVRWFVKHNRQKCNKNNIWTLIWTSYRERDAEKDGTCMNGHTSRGQTD